MALRATTAWLVPESARAGPNCVCVCLLAHVVFLVGVLVLTLVFLTLVLLVILELPVLLLPLLVFECWLLFAYRMTYTCAHCVVRQRSLRSPHTSSPWAWDQASAVYYVIDVLRKKNANKKWKGRWSPQNAKFLHG